MLQEQNHLVRRRAIEKAYPEVMRSVTASVPHPSGTQYGVVASEHTRRRSDGNTDQELAASKTLKKSETRSGPLGMMGGVPQPRQTHSGFKSNSTIVNVEHGAAAEDTISSDHTVGGTERDIHALNGNANASQSRKSSHHSQMTATSHTTTTTNATDVTLSIGREDAIAPFHPTRAGTISGAPAKPARKTQIVGDWKLGKMIGQGSCGKVRIARHTETGKMAVAKIMKRPKLPSGKYTTTELELESMSLDPKSTVSDAQKTSLSSPPTSGNEALQKIYRKELYMIREAAIGIRLSHPNVVSLYSATLSEDHFYCFFEYVEGEDLVDYVAKKGRLSEAAGRKIFRQICDAIEYAHRNHVVHRDIKLENVRINRNTNQIKLLDFGFASFHDSTGNEDWLLETNCGSPCYAAPEIYEGSAYVGPEVDIWSMGVCLYAMLVGSMPFEGQNFRQLSRAVRSGIIDYPKHLSGDVIDLIKWMLMVDPNRRATLPFVLNHCWVNHTFSSPPVSYQNEVQAAQQQAFSFSQVRRVMQADSICVSGNLLMKGLQDDLENKSNELSKMVQQNQEHSLFEDGDVSQTEDDMDTASNATSQQSVDIRTMAPDPISQNGTPALYTLDLPVSKTDSSTNAAQKQSWWKRLWVRKADLPRYHNRRLWGRFHHQLSHFPSGMSSKDSLPTSFVSVNTVGARSAHTTMTSPRSMAAPSGGLPVPHPPHQSYLYPNTTQGKSASFTQRSYRSDTGLSVIQRMGRFFRGRLPSFHMFPSSDLRLKRQPQPDFARLNGTSRTAGLTTLPRRPTTRW